MQDHIPDALITAFERQYDSSWNDPQLRNERMAMHYGWAAAMEAKQCLHQIQEPAPATAMDALREAEAALEVAMARILKADPGHSICVTSEAKALVAVRAALAAPAAVAVPESLRAVLIDVIAQGLSGTWHCSRVWEAWHVGTMSQEDFSPADESDTPTELADAVLTALAATPAAAPTDEPVFLQRLRVEQQELDARQQKLGAFIESSEFRLLSETDAALLSKQEALQHVLLQTLNQRIHSASEKHMREKRNA